MRRTLRGSLRTGGDPIRLARRRRRVAPRRLVLLCDISGSMEPYARAYLQFLVCAARTGPNAEAFVFATRLTRLTRALDVTQPGARDPARGRSRSRLVERHPHRRRAARVQRPSRPPRHGPRRGDRDPLRRLGARRPDARRARDAAARAASRIASCGSIRASSSDAFSVQSGGMVAALPYCDALVSGHSFQALGEVAEAIGAASWDDSPADALAASCGRRGRALGERHAAPGQLGRDAERARPEPRQHDARAG